MIVFYIIFGLFALVGLAILIFVFKGIGRIILSLFGYVFGNSVGCLYYVFMGFILLSLLLVLL